MLKDSWIHTIFKQSKKVDISTNKQGIKQKQTTIVEDDEWEPANYDDLSSDNYEIIK